MRDILKGMITCGARRTKRFTDPVGVRSKKNGMAITAKTRKLAADAAGKGRLRTVRVGNLSLEEIVRDARAPLREESRADKRV